MEDKEKKLKALKNLKQIISEMLHQAQLFAQSQAQIDELLDQLYRINQEIIDLENE